MMLLLSWVGNVFIVFGLWHQAKQVWWAYVFSIAGEALWITYALSAHLWSLALICTVFGGLALRSMIMWRKQALNA